jgi:hypothetical protein
MIEPAAMPKSSRLMWTEFVWKPDEESAGEAIRVA